MAEFDHLRSIADAAAKDIALIEKNRMQLIKTNTDARIALHKQFAEGQIGKEDHSKQMNNLIKTLKASLLTTTKSYETAFNRGIEYKKAWELKLQQGADSRVTENKAANMGVYVSFGGKGSSTNNGGKYNFVLQGQREVVKNYIQALTQRIGNRGSIRNIKTQMDSNSVSVTIELIFGAGYNFEAIHTNHLLDIFKGGG